MPAIVGIVVMSLYNIVDRIFIGQGVGPDAIAGLAITFPVMNLATALGMLIGAGDRYRVCTKQEEDRGTGGLPEGTGDKRVILSRRARCRLTFRAAGEMEKG